MTFSIIQIDFTHNLTLYHFKTEKGSSWSQVGPKSVTSWSAEPQATSGSSESKITNLNYICITNLILKSFIASSGWGMGVGARLPKFLTFLYNSSFSLREVCGKSKWKFLMAFAIRGRGVSRGSRLPLSYFEK